MLDPRTPEEATGSDGERARPRATPAGPIDARRVVAGSIAIVAASAGAVAVVRAIGDGGARSVLAFVLGLAVVPLVASPLEWIVHRFVYHAPALRPLANIFKVHTVHHYSYFPTWRYTTGGPARRLSVGSGPAEVHSSPVRNAGVRLAHFCWYMAIGVVVVWLPSWVATGSEPFLAGIVLSSIVISNLFIVVHDTIHRPGSHRIVEAQPWFAFLDRHHWVHHIDLGTNLNFLLPLADLLFGTLRTSPTSEESAVHGTLAGAKARPLGQGERAALAANR